MSLRSPSLAELTGATPNGIGRLVHDTIERVTLDLRGLTVLTEAATGPFAATAAIAGVAGADLVLAIARDSVHGTAGDAREETTRVARACGAGKAVQVITQLDAATVGAGDVVTNLGFVRPLDARTVGWMKLTAVISLMCEAWEYRPGDVELEACRARGILVLATNEHAPSLPVFSYCGALAERLLLDAGVGVRNAHLAVLGRDPFTPVIASALVARGAHVKTDDSLAKTNILAAITGSDAIVVAEYRTEDVVLGDGGIVSAVDCARAAPHSVIVQFAGALDAASLQGRGLVVYPAPPVGPRRMARTLAHLGARPVVELHAAGLKVGELGARARLQGLAAGAAAVDVCRRSELAQFLPPWT